MREHDLSQRGNGFDAPESNTVSMKSTVLPSISTHSKLLPHVWVKGTFQFLHRMAAELRTTAGYMITRWEAYVWATCSDRTHTQPTLIPTSWTCRRRGHSKAQFRHPRSKQWAKMTWRPQARWSHTRITDTFKAVDGTNRYCISKYADELGPSSHDSKSYEETWQRLGQKTRGQKPCRTVQYK